MLTGSFQSSHWKAKLYYWRSLLEIDLLLSSNVADIRLQKLPWTWDNLSSAVFMLMDMLKGRDMFGNQWRGNWGQKTQPWKRWISDALVTCAHGWVWLQSGVNRFGISDEILGQWNPCVCYNRLSSLIYFYNPISAIKVSVILSSGDNRICFRKFRRL